MPAVPVATSAAALALGVALSFMLHQASGASIDLFVTVIILIAVIAPLVVVWNVGIATAAASSAALIVGAMSSWFWLALRGIIPWTDAIHASLVGFLVGFAAAGTARLLSGKTGNARLWPGIISILAFAWTTWPVWLSVPLAGKSLIGSVAIQPLFAVNSAVSDLGNWVDQPMAYQLTNFGQDVLYKMPRSIWPAVAFHGSIAIVTWTLAFWLARRLNLPSPPPP